MAESTQKLLTVRIEEAFLQQLRVATVARDTTIAHIVRTALADWLKSNPVPKGQGRGSSARGRSSDKGDKGTTKRKK